jgi:hypothetical protein
LASRPFSPRRPSSALVVLQIGCPFLACRQKSGLECPWWCTPAERKFGLSLHWQNCPCHGPQNVKRLLARNQGHSGKLCVLFIAFSGNMVGVQGGGVKLHPFPSTNRNIPFLEPPQISTHTAWAFVRVQC